MYKAGVFMQGVMLSELCNSRRQTDLKLQRAVPDTALSQQATHALQLWMEQNTNSTKAG